MHSIPIVEFKTQNSNIQWLVLEGRFTIKMDSWK